MAHLNRWTLLLVVLSSVIIIIPPSGVLLFENVGQEDFHIYDDSDWEPHDGESPHVILASHLDPFPNDELNSLLHQSKKQFANSQTDPQPTTEDEPDSASNATTESPSVVTQAQDNEKQEMESNMETSKPELAPNLVKIEQPQMLVTVEPNLTFTTETSNNEQVQQQATSPSPTQKESDPSSDESTESPSVEIQQQDSDSTTLETPPKPYLKTPPDPVEPQTQFASQPKPVPSTVVKTTEQVQQQPSPTQQVSMPPSDESNEFPSPEMSPEHQDFDLPKSETTAPASETNPTPAPETDPTPAPETDPPPAPETNPTPAPETNSTPVKIERPRKRFTPQPNRLTSTVVSTTEQMQRESTTPDPAIKDEEHKFVDHEDEMDLDNEPSFDFTSLLTPGILISTLSVLVIGIMYQMMSANTNQPVKLDMQQPAPAGKLEKSRAEDKIKQENKLKEMRLIETNKQLKRQLELAPLRKAIDELNKENLDDEIKQKKLIIAKYKRYEKLSKANENLVSRVHMDRYIRFKRLKNMIDLKTIPDKLHDLEWTAIFTEARNKMLEMEASIEFYQDQMHLHSNLLIQFEKTYKECLSQIEEEKARGERIREEKTTLGLNHGILERV